MPNIDRYTQRPGVYTINVEVEGENSSTTTYYGTDVDIVRERRSSVNTPGFRNLKRKHKGASLPVHPFRYRKELTGGVSGTLVKYSGFPSTRRIYAGEGLIGFTGTMYNDGAVISDAEKSALDGVVRTKLRLKLKDQKVNLAQAYAERSMTAKLLAETATRIYRTISDLRKGDLLSAATHVGITSVSKRAQKRYKREFKRAPASAPASGWLQLQYGWQPLLNDVYGSAELLASRPFAEVYNRVAAQSVRSVSKDQQLIRTGMVNGYDGTETVKSVTDYTVKYVVWYATGSEALHTLSSVGISNPALLAWELLPFSFVADWFLPVGNYLSSLDATLGLQFIKGSVTTSERTKTTMVRVGSQGVPAFGSTGTITDIRSRYESLDIQRSVIYDFPSIALPSFKNPISFVHAANAIALLTQLFKK